MKKKFISMILAAAMLAATAGCGKTPPAGPEGSSAGDAQAPAAENSEAVSGEEAEEEAKGFAVAENPDDWPVVTVQTTGFSVMPDEQLIEDALNEYLVSIHAGIKADLVQIVTESGLRWKR